MSSSPLPLRCTSLLIKRPHSQTQGYAAQSGIQQGLLTSILELGAWVGTLANGYLADALGRRVTVLVAVIVFCVGVIVQACTESKDYVYGGRFVTGLGVGSLSMVVPLYNAELVCSLFISQCLRFLLIDEIVGAARDSRFACRRAATSDHIWHHGQLLGKSGRFTLY